MTEPKGEFTSEWAPADLEIVCPHCNQRAEYRNWESANGAHEDVQFRCKECNVYWWAEGPDA